MFRIGTAHQLLGDGTLPSDDAIARQITITANEYAMQDGLLYHYFQPRSRNSTRATIRHLVIPNSLREQILIGFHENSSHPGFHRCYQAFA